MLMDLAVYLFSLSVHHFIAVNLNFIIKLLIQLSFVSLFNTLLIFAVEMYQMCVVGEVQSSVVPEIRELQNNFSWKGPLNAIQSVTPTRRRDVFNQTRSLRALSNLTVSISREKMEQPGSHSRFLHLKKLLQSLQFALSQCVPSPWIVQIADRQSSGCFGG